MRPTAASVIAQDPSHQRWVSWLAWVSLGLFTSLWIARWPSFPLARDPAYHLFIGRQVADAGGILSYEWWENAPIGRPHLYPPILHLVLAAFLKLGWSPLVVIRVFSAFLPPFLLLSVWSVMRRCIGEPLALATLLVGMSPWYFHLHSAIAMAATLGMIEWLWLIAAIQEDRPVAGGMLLALLWYTHLALPWIVVLTLIGYGWCEPSARPRLRRVAWGLLLAVPWWLHLLQHRQLFQIIPRQENRFVELSPMIFLFAAIGFWHCWRRKGFYRLFPAFLGGCAVLAPAHAYRWLCGEGMLPFVLLSGVGMEWAARQLARRLLPSAVVSHVAHVGIVSVMAVGLALGAPTLTHAVGGWQWHWPNSAPWHLMRGPSIDTVQDTDVTLYTPSLERLVRRLSTESRPGEILWSNAPYALGLVAALAHRPTASAMLTDVMPEEWSTAVSRAQLIVWFKFEPLPSLLTSSRFIRLDEDALALVLRQAVPMPQAHAPQAVYPLGLSLAMLGIAVWCIVWELSAPTSRRRRAVRFVAV